MKIWLPIVALVALGVDWLVGTADCSLAFWPMILGAVLGAGGQALKAGADAEAEDSFHAWEEKNRLWAEADRDLMLNLFQESRGGGRQSGSAILPVYFGTGDQSFEKRLAGDIMGGYDASKSYYGSPSQRLGAFTQAVNQVSPATQGAIGTVNELYTGKTQRDAEASLAPALAARTALGKTTRAGFLQALNERLNSIQSSERAKGYTGSGSSAQRSLMRESFAGNTAASQAEAAAALENALQKAAMQEAYRKIMLANVGVPFQLAQTNAGLVSLPVNAAEQSYSAALNPLSFFRIGNSPPYSAIPRTPFSVRPEVTDREIWMNYGGDQMSQVGGMLMGGGLGGMGGGGGMPSGGQMAQGGLKAWGGNIGFGGFG